MQAALANKGPKAEVACHQHYRRPMKWDFSVGLGGNTQHTKAGGPLGLGNSEYTQEPKKPRVFWHTAVTEHMWTGE